MDAELITTAYALDIIDDEEFMICMLPSYEERLYPRLKLDLANMTADQARKNFRFEMQDLERLCNVLKFPAVATGLETLCITLR